MPVPVLVPVPVVSGSRESVIGLSLISYRSSVIAHGSSLISHPEFNLSQFP